MTAGPARAHHSIPQGYLRAWRGVDGLVDAYRLLVPDERYPVWQRRSLRTLTRYDDLYTSSFLGEDSDEVERWLNEEVEGPATEPLAKARRGGRLGTRDWERLLKYVIALDRRTPEAYLEFKERADRDVPEILERTLKGLETRMRSEVKRRKDERVELRPQGTVEGGRKPFPLRVTMVPVPDEGKTGVRAEVTVGRQMWLWDLQRIVGKFAPIVAQHDWAILLAPPGFSWFTSDHPVVRLNYYSGHPEHYDFGGGWGREGTEIFVALSSERLLYTQVGRPAPPTPIMPMELAGKVQRFIAERAHRWVIASGQPARVAWWRPRVVDRAAFLAEEEAWAGWNSHQKAVERSDGASR